MRAMRAIPAMKYIRHFGHSKSTPSDSSVEASRTSGCLAPSEDLSCFGHGSRAGTGTSG